MKMRNHRLSTLLLAVLLAISCSTSFLTAEAAATKSPKSSSKSSSSKSPSPSPASSASGPATLLQLLHSDPQLSLFSMLVAHFPDIQLRLANSDLAVTAFLPNDQAIMKEYKFKTYQDAVFTLNTLSDVVAPAGTTKETIDDGAPGLRRYFWKVLNVHFLSNSTVLMTKDMAKGLIENSAMVEYGADAAGRPEEYVDTIVFEPRSSSSKKQVLRAENQGGPASIIKGDIKGGKAVVHIVDGVLSPSNAPLSHSETIIEFCAESYENPDLTAIAAAAKGAGFDIEAQAVPLTFFCPRGEGMKRFYASAKTNASILVKNATACVNFLKAHTATSGPLAGTALYTTDLYAMAAMNARRGAVGGSWFGDQSRLQNITFLNGNTATPSVTYNGITAGPLTLLARKPGSAQVTKAFVTDLDWGGNAVGVSTISVVHPVTEVLPF